MAKTAWQIYLDEVSPIAAAIRSLTPAQHAALMDTSRINVVEGGNQAGKTRTACISAVADALDLHPTGKHGQYFDVWYCTTTFQLFSQQAWGHMQRLLLLPGESIHKLPTTYVKKIDWLRAGSIPQNIWLNTGNCISVRTYDQGRSEFQAKTLYRAIIDEEAPEPIWDELRARMLACHEIEPRIMVVATPIEGALWLADLREKAAQGVGWISHHRLSTFENPGVNLQVLDELAKELKDRPELFALRVQGFPMALQGLVYNDTQFTPEHVVTPFPLTGGDWTRYRCIDHGYRNCGCLWMAVNQRQDTIVIYRDYLGKERSLAQNAEAIRAYEGADVLYYRSWIDPATAQTDACTGRRVIELWRDKGVWVNRAPDNRVISGIERCKDLLGKRGGPNLDRPLLLVFNTCKEFLRERRSYKWPKLRPSGDVPDEKPEKRDDHLMDCFRYLVAAGLTYVSMDGRMAPPDKETNPVGYAFWSQRHMTPGGDEL